MTSFMPPAAACLLLMLSPAIAQNASPGALKGLKTVNIEIERLDKNVQEDGLTESAIQTQVELHLRSAGITISASPAVLHVEVGTLKLSNGGYVYDINMRLTEVVQIRNKYILASTWSAGSYGYRSASDIAAITTYISNNVDEFANEWLRDNPK